MGDREEMLDEVFRLTNQQAKSLRSRLSEEEANKCRLRAQRIEELLERIKNDGFSGERISGDG
jgi:hypothetical protein